MVFYQRACFVGIMLLLSGCASNMWISGWKNAPPMNVQRNGAATVIANDKIYIIGGRNNTGSLATTEYTTIRKDGSLEPWKYGTKLNIDRGYMGGMVHGGYIYVVGGANGTSDKELLRSVERAEILPDGTLGPWQMEKNEMLVPRRCNKVLATDKAMYAFGGYGGVLLDSVESAEWQPDGSLGEWHLEPEILTAPRYINTVKKVGDVFFVIGGHQDNGNSMDGVEWSRPMADGKLQKWQATTPMSRERWGHGTVVYGEDMYAIGGFFGPKYLDSIEHAKVGKDGQLGQWQLTTASLDQPRATFGAIVYKDWIYVIGGAYPDGYLSSVIYSNLNPAGDIGYWGSAEEARKAKARQARRKELAKKLKLPYEGVVKEVLQTRAYTYAEVESKVDGLVWLAGPKLDNLKAGDHVGYNLGTPLHDFSSRELQRIFPRLIMVGKIQIQ